MEPGRVKSTSLRNVEFDFVASKLRVTFQSGSRYEYDNVTLAEYIALICAPSIGCAFNAIKDKFTYTKIKSIKIYGR